MESYNLILSCKNTHELNLSLNKELQRIQESGKKLSSEETSYLEKVPILIQELHAKDMNSTTSGLKRQRISKEAAESAFFCFQMAVGKSVEISDVSNSSILMGANYLQNLKEGNVLKIEMTAEYENLRQKFNADLYNHLKNQKPMSDESLRAQRYCFTLAKILNIDLSKTSLTGLNYLPPQNITLNEKIEYNRVAVKLNREIEKRNLQEYAEEISILSSTKSLITTSENIALKNALIGYQRMIEFDYPNLTDHELNVLAHSLKFHAEILGIDLSDEQLGLQEEIPVFGISNITVPASYKKEKYPSAEAEIYFHENLIRYDLMTQYMKISTLLRNLKPTDQPSVNILNNETNPPVVQSILEQKKKLEQVLPWCLFKPPSIESWEGQLGKLLAINEDCEYFTLSDEQKTGQSPLMVSADPKTIENYLASLEQKVKHLEIVQGVMFGNNDLALKALEKTDPNNRKDIDELFNQYESSPGELDRAIILWRGHIEWTKLVFTNTELTNPDWDDFFNRGLPKLSFD